MSSTALRLEEALVGTIVMRSTMASNVPRGNSGGIPGGEVHRIVTELSSSTFVVYNCPRTYLR